MLMLSADDVSRLFVDFGLAFVRKDSQKSYSNVRKLIERVKEYGELKSTARASV
jgi:hypothetical protein